MRFAEQFHHEASLSDSEKIEAEKLMFIELSQSKHFPSIFGLCLLSSGFLFSLPLGELD